MLYGLSGCNETRIKSRRALELFHDFFGFIDNAFDGRAGLAPGALANQLEDRLKALDLALSFFLVSNERFLQFFVLRTTCHFTKRRRDLALGVVDVFQRLVKKIVQGFLRHFVLLCVELTEPEELMKVPVTSSTVPSIWIDTGPMSSFAPTLCACFGRPHKRHLRAACLAAAML
jgi:hypothetical protein